MAGPKFTEEERKERARARHRQWRIDNPEAYKRKKNAATKKWRAQNPEKAKAKGQVANKNRKAKRHSGATRLKPDACEICSTVGPVEYDHCHDSEQFRGWLCTRCNLGLGLFRDNPTFLLAAIKYLTVGP